MSPGIRSANIRRFARPDSLTLEDTARLLRLRGEAMQKAVPVGEGAMAAILGLDFGAVVKIATQAASDLYLTGAICQAANDNGGNQVVVSGTSRRPSSARSSSPSSLARNGRCFCPSRRRFIARSCSRRRRRWRKR